MDLVGAAEVAALLGVSRQRVNAIATSASDFPPPLAELAAGRVWSRDAIEAWALRRARLDEMRIVRVAGVAIELPVEPVDLERVMSHLTSGVPVLLDCRALSALAFRRISDAAIGVTLATPTTLIEGGRTLLLVPAAARLAARQRRAVEQYLERTSNAHRAKARQKMSYDNLADYFRTEFGVELGEKTLAELASVASTQANIVHVEAEVRGRDVATNTAKTVTVRLADVTDHLA